MFDTKSKNCAFNDQIVSYFYAEFDGENKCAFETHLKNCAFCLEELAGFDAVRASLLDWRAQEFDLLETPIVEIDFEKKKRFPKVETPAAKKRSWFDSFRQNFNFSPGFAAVAAVILTTVCAALLAYNFSDGRQIAQLESKANLPRTKTSAETENVIPKSTAAFGDDKKDNQFTAKDLRDSNNSIDKNVSSPDKRENIIEKRIVKTAKNFQTVAYKQSNTQKNYGLPRSRKFSETNAVLARSGAPADLRRIPKLSNIDDEDDEDAGLRLTDLFDEAGGR